MTGLITLKVAYFSENLILMFTTRRNYRYDGLQVESGHCARLANDSRIDLVNCDSLLSNHRPGGRGLTFELTNDGRLVTTTSGDCLTVTSSYYVIRQSCNTTRNEYQVKISSSSS